MPSHQINQPEINEQLAQIPDFSVVIVSYNVAPLLEECLNSLLDNRESLSLEIIVVDNASHDGSPALVRSKFPQARLIENFSNYGFPRGCNQGLRQATGRYIFFLNPDARLEKGVLKTLFDFMEENPACGIAGPGIRYPDGTTQPNRRRFPGPGLAFVESTILQRYRPFKNLKALRRFNVEDVSAEITQQVDWLVGAAFVVRREVVEQIGGLDERYFMYSEELDYCRRTRLAGWEVWYTPAATVVHQEGQSSKQDVPFRHINFQTSKIAYYRKFYGRSYAGILRNFLLATYLFQYGEEWLKLQLRHKPDLRRERLALIRKVLASGLRPYKSPFPPAPVELNLTLLSAEFPPQPGGVGDYTACLAKALQEAGTGQVRVLTGRTATSDAEDFPYKVVRIKGWGWTSLPLIAARFKGEARQVVNIQYQTGAYRMHPAINFLPLYLRFKLGKARPKIVTTFHDLRVPYLFPKAGKVRTWVNRLLLKTSDRAIMTNPADYQQALAWGINESRLRLVPIGSNIEAGANFPSDLDRAVFRRGLGLNEGDFAIGYFGLVNRSKGLDTLLTALASLVKEDRSFKLVIIGGETGQTDTTNTAYAGEIASLVEKLGLSEAVIRTGHQTAEETSRLFYAIDAVALPFRDGASFRRGSLLAPLAHGLPVISTWPPTGPEMPGNLGGIPGDPQLLDGRNILLVNPEDPAQLATVIRRVREEPELRATLQSGAFTLARHFGWPEIARRTLAIYIELFQE
ncbi:MAG: glycosyltransferase [Chloroflexi bacterium]|nr:glycosyltransferase [Chloroflexota bacterium]